MSGDPTPPITGLRSRYERARTLDLEGQIRDCVDYLQNPEVLAAELVDAYLAIELAYTPTRSPSPARGDATQHQGVGRFEPPSQIAVIDPVLETEMLLVTCLAGEFVPLAPGRAAAPLAEEMHGGLDYLGLSRGDPPGPVLGAVQSGCDTTPYLLFLRLLACLAEIAPPAQLAYLDEAIFKGALAGTPLFDLQMVLWDQPEDPQQSTLMQLTHDVSDVLLRELSLEPTFPSILRGVLCMRVHERVSNGTAMFDWRV